MILLGLSMYPYLKIFGFVTALQFNIRSYLGGGGGGGRSCGEKQHWI